MTTGQVRLQWFGWLRMLLAAWVRAKIVPTQNLAGELGINLQEPICYILKSNSIFDFLVLDLYCLRVGLPRPLAGLDDLGGNKDAASVYLSKVGILRTYGAYRHEPPSPFFKLLGRVSVEPGFEVQMVPVSVFWGRDPGSSSGSVFKLLFPDDDRASFFQKAAIVLAQGKNVLVTFSKPISLRGQLTADQSIDQTARKLTRVVRVHFQNKRAAALGPGLISRSRVIETLIRSKPLKVAIEEECRKKNIPRERAERLAKEYISEIAAEVTPQVIVAASIILKRVWNRIYNGIQAEHMTRLTEIPSNAEIIYIPCHRSHMDYLLINYVLYQQGQLTPHVAAGINLNFWPFGSLCRKLGAFYIRRSFANNRLYTVAFSEYVSFLVSRGSPVQFFTEGGRSRTGKLLQPKTGMISMVVRSFLRSRERPIYFVPIYIGYDRVAEVKTYRKELAGAKKQTESIGQVVKSRKALSTKYGRAYMAIGKPVNLEEVLDREHTNWRNEKVDFESKPEWLFPAVQTVATEVMENINASAVVGPVALVSLILQATRQKALAEDELMAHLTKFLEISKKCPYSPDVRFPEMEPRAIVEYAEHFGKLSRFQHPSGDVIHVIEPQASYNVYYRNNIVHSFALPSLMAFFLQHNDAIREDFLVTGCQLIYPILRREFFLRWKNNEIESVIRQYLATFIELGLFQRNDRGELTRPDVTSHEFAILRTLGLIVGAAVERYSVAVNLLSQYQTGGIFQIDDFQNKCVLMALRISLLTGASDSELPSPGLFKLILDHMASEKILEQVGENAYRLTEAFGRAFEVTSALLSIDIRHSMSRIKA